jgi:hypothetical protein
MRVAKAGLEQGVVTIPAAAFGEEEPGLSADFVLRRRRAFERRRAAVGVQR